MLKGRARNLQPSELRMAIHNLALSERKKLLTSISALWKALTKMAATGWLKKGKKEKESLSHETSQRRGKSLEAPLRHGGKATAGPSASSESLKAASKTS